MARDLAVLMAAPLPPGKRISFWHDLPLTTKLPEEVSEGGGLWIDEESEGGTGRDISGLSSLSHSPCFDSVACCVRFPIVRLSLSVDPLTR